MPEVSVVMSIYNESIDFLKASIDSILSQTFMDFEFIIIVDNPNHNIAIQYLQRITDKRVRLIINDKNLGLPKSLNIGIENARGSYIARMDADDISMVDRFQKQLDYIKSNKLDLCGTYTINIDEKTQVLSKEKIYHLSTDTVSELLNYRSPIPHPTWFAKREIFLELEGYRNFHSCEDYDFLLRAKIAGKVLGLVPEYLLYYRQNSQSISNSNSYKQFISARILKKYRKKILYLNENNFNSQVSSKLNMIKAADFEKSKQLLRLASNSSGYKRLSLVAKSIFYSPEIVSLYYVSAMTFYIRNFREKMKRYGYKIER